MNETLVMNELRQRIGRINPADVRSLMAYAIGGAGIDNMDPILDKLTTEDILRTRDLFNRWMGDRNLTVFYETLFKSYGYKCHEVSTRTLKLRLFCIAVQPLPIRW